jgi:hypothetical protein
VVLLGSGQALGIAMGAALLVMPLIGAWALVRELQFGLAADRLGRTLNDEGGMPEAPEHLRSNGRLLPEDADRLLAEYGAAAEEPGTGARSTAWAWSRTRPGGGRTLAPRSAPRSAWRSRCSAVLGDGAPPVARTAAPWRARPSGSRRGSGQGRLERDLDARQRGETGQPPTSCARRWKVSRRGRARRRSR